MPEQDSHATDAEIKRRTLGDDADVFAPLRLAACHRAYVIAQLGQSLDGRIATVTGESRYINGSAALDHLHGIRAHVDAVLVGVGTVLADDPQLTVRRCAGQSPARVVLDPNGRVPAGARCFAADGARRLLVTRKRGRAPEGVEEIVVEGEGVIPPGAVVEALFRRGMRRILIEGGARTISHFMDADAVDRLHVLVAPLIIGAGRLALDLAPEPVLARARRPATRVHVFADGDVLFDCDLRQGRASDVDNETGRLFASR
ncbi:5-amino-6-(5-phosphoribosylamino)uracil reductase [Alsobacter metallidurans]|uniref:5-amino-6-(5-phosphoribosylamino)uracil reductase n=1 Tax=Alsobacter metallidurans TaxID=340221 RepID=A0A917I8N7_9HYPH|nr:RibD family protein [Alsobacter metallidurans]GGH23198.1 5-amino-6-(5-phosphoribosylamino)uracil reductase [Alsobacter metallidurans]